MSEPFSDSEIREIRGACADGPYPVSIGGETWQAVEARWLATHDALVRERDALREALRELLSTTERTEDTSEEWARYLRAKVVARAALESRS